MHGTNPQKEQASSFVSKHGLWSDEQKDAAERMRRLVEEQNLHSIRLSFPDQHGILRGKTLMGASDIPEVGRIAMVSDPQGAPFYLMKPTPPADKPDAASDVFSPTQPQRVSWNELNTSDPNGARSFYGEQFGWTSDDFMPMGEMGEYRFWMHQGLALGAVCGLMGQAHPKWRFYFRVPSIADAKATIDAKGGKVTNGPHEVPGGDYVIIGIDPQGAEFAVVGGA